MSLPLELILLSSYRLASKYRQSLGNDEAAAFIHGYLLLWNPKLIVEASQPPTVASPFDHETPKGNVLYTLPSLPFSYLPEDWRTRLEGVASKTIESTPEWAGTLSHARQQWELTEDAEALPFYGLGLGYLVLEAYCEASDHSNPLDVQSFWNEVKQAAAEPDHAHALLEAAAIKLKEAREIVYPSGMYQLLLGVLEGREESLPLTPWLELPFHWNWLGTTDWLKRFVAAQPTEAEKLRGKLRQGQGEWIGGPMWNLPDGILPAELAIRNITSGMKELLQVTEQPMLVYGRKRFAASPLWPSLLKACGLSRAYGNCLDSGGMPYFRSINNEWVAHDGEVISALNRKPEPIEDVQTVFHLAYLLHQTATQDYTATLMLGSQHLEAAPPMWLSAWASLHSMAAVFGQSTSFSNYLMEVPHGERMDSLTIDDFQSDYLLDLTGHGEAALRQKEPISHFAKLFRQHAAATHIGNMQGILAAISAHFRSAKEGKAAELKIGLQRLQESFLENAEQDVTELTKGTAQALADRFISSNLPKIAGYLLINSTGQERVVCEKLPGVVTPLPAPALATQLDTDGAWVSVTVPPCGFAWLPRKVEAGAIIRKPKTTMVENGVLRNQYITIEPDPKTGGIKTIRDTRTDQGRMGQQLVFHPGSKMVAKSCNFTQNGPVVAECVTEGALLSAHDDVLAFFTQTFRVCWGQPFATIRIKLQPSQPVNGYPWHAFYASRFAWRDPATVLHRGVGWSRGTTSQTRPESPHFHEIDVGSYKTAILTGGLPFAQKHSQRMLDVLLHVEGETATEFELAITLDQDDPLSVSQAWLTPVSVVAVEHGPPASGPVAWLFHLDCANVLLSEMVLTPSLTQGSASHSSDLNPSDKQVALVAIEFHHEVLLRLMETRNVATDVTLSCPRNPIAAETLDEFGNILETLVCRDDTVSISFPPSAMRLVRVKFS